MLKAINGPRAPIAVAPAESKPRGAEIRLTRRIGSDRRGQPFVFSPADVGKVFSIGAGCGFGVEVDRQAEFIADAAAERAGECRAFRHGNSLDGDEGDDVGCADARVNAFVEAQVDPVGGAFDRGECGIDYNPGAAGDCDDSPVMVAVARGIEQAGARNGADGGEDRADGSPVAAFGKIRDALDDRRRQRPLPGRKKHRVRRCLRRRGWDLNPRSLAAHALSKRAH